MSPKKRVKTCETESVSRCINEHMTSVGEEILEMLWCVLLEQQRDVDVCCREKRLNVEVFVLQRLSAAAEWMCSLFHRETQALLETLHSAEERSPSLDQEEPQPPQIKEEPEEMAEVSTMTSLQMRCNTVSDFLHFPVCKLEERRSPGLVKEEPEPPPPSNELLQRPEEEAGGSTSSLLAVKSNSDYDDDDENEETEPLASTSTENELNPPEEARPTRSRHAGEKNFSCPECGKTFIRTGHLKIHRMVHTGDNPYTCTVCGKGCSQNSVLKIHMRSHTGEKPFTCTVCGKGCVDVSGLRSHMRTHTGEKPFVCTVCGKGCSRKNDLKIHLRTHTGEKPFTCAVCNKAFVHVGHLRRHMKTHMF